MRPSSSHSARQRRRSCSSADGGLVAILGRLGEEFHHDLGEDGRGRSPAAPQGGIGFLAIWQWTHSMGSAALNGNRPVSI